ncbi:MAG: hypothetical protein IR164_03850 [Devosia sp.]|uniref:hypothetical protein n=1 Tax=Devosia sp. TaxID=1871048 RepID=UPI0019E4D925|nr:hypothetical protein [Devosia sp.]MBF0678058.1 hypothetical protein [Devosia sp.]
METAYLLIALIFGQSGTLANIAPVNVFPTEQACIAAMESILQSLPDADRSTFLCINAETGKSQVQELMEEFPTPS